MTSLKKRFLNYINKEGFNHAQSKIDPLQYHSFFISFAKMFSVMDLETKPWWMYVSPVVVACSGVWAVTLITYSIVIYFPDFSTKYDIITECATYWLVLAYKTVIVSRCFTNRTNYYHLMRALREDFEYISGRGIKYRDGFFENQRLIFKACVLVGIFTMFIGNGIIFYSFFAWTWAKIKNKPRPLPFPLVWFWGDVHEAPYFQLIFLQCIWFTISHTYTYVFYIVSQVLWAGEIICKADICVWQINDLLADVEPTKDKKEEEYYKLIIKHRMREIVKIHHSMIELLEHYAACYQICLLVEQKISSPIICLTAYCAAEKIEGGDLPMILILLCAAVIVVVYIPSYICTFLAEKTESVGHAWMYIPFWKGAKVIRPYAVIMMQRSMRRLPMQAAGFDEISLRTYANLLSRSYQWFTMLRQANFNK